MAAACKTALHLFGFSALCQYSTLLLVDLLGEHTLTQVLSWCSCYSYDFCSAQSFDLKV